MPKLYKIVNMIDVLMKNFEVIANILILYGLPHGSSSWLGELFFEMFILITPVSNVFLKKNKIFYATK